MPVMLFSPSLCVCCVSCVKATRLHPSHQTITVHQSTSPRPQSQIRSKEIRMFVENRVPHIACASMFIRILCEREETVRLSGIVVHNFAYKQPCNSSTVTAGPCVSCEIIITNSICKKIDITVRSAHNSHNNGGASTGLAIQSYSNRNELTPETGFVGISCVLCESYSSNLAR